MSKYDDPNYLYFYRLLSEAKPSVLRKSVTIACVRCGRTVTADGGTYDRKALTLAASGFKPVGMIFYDRDDPIFCAECANAEVELIRKSRESRRPKRR